MACDFCQPQGIKKQFIIGNHCKNCDLFLLSESSATHLCKVLEADVWIRVWLEVYMQSSHSESLGALLGKNPPRKKHEGLFHPIKMGKMGGVPSMKDIIDAYAKYSAEARDIADEQISQLRGVPYKGGWAPLPEAAKAKIGFGTRGEKMDAAIQMTYISPLGLRYELTWFHINNDIVAVKIHCYPHRGQPKNHDLIG